MATYKDRKGVWRWRWEEKQPDGHVLRASGTPKVQTKAGAAEAERQGIAAARAKRNGVSQANFLPPPECPTFTQWSQTFLAQYAAVHNKPSERAAKEGILKHHLLPTLGDRRLDKITTADVEALKARLLKTDANPEGLTAKRVNNVLHVLSKMLRYAAELEVIAVAPRVKCLKTAPSAFDFLTFEELEQLVVGASAEPMWLAAVLLGAEAGLRLGELQALRWADVDLDRGQLVVMQSNWRGKIGAPKGSRDRKIPLTSRLRSALKALPRTGAYVICREDGSLTSNTNFRAAMKRLLKGAGLRHIGWHALRHTFCSHLAMRGAPAKAIQDLAGHQSIAVTNRYMHLSPSALRSAIDLLEAR